MLLRAGALCYYERRCMDDGLDERRRHQGGAEWLVDGARSAAQPQQIMAQLCDRLLCCGIPLWRAAVSVSTLHPQIVARRFIWRPGAEVEVSEGRFGLFDTPEFRDSPVAHVIATRETLRRRLADPACPLDFPILLERRSEGVTDYLATPLFFTDGTIHLATWTSRQPAGLSDMQIAGIEAIVAPLARVAEIWAMRRTAGTLLDTYVGPHAGARILAGQIRRGDIEKIHAAIWLSVQAVNPRMSDSQIAAWISSMSPRRICPARIRSPACRPT